MRFEPLLLFPNNDTVIFETIRMNMDSNPQPQAHYYQSDNELAYAYAVLILNNKDLNRLKLRTIILAFGLIRKVKMMKKLFFFLIRKFGLFLYL